MCLFCVSVILYEPILCCYSGDIKAYALLKEHLYMPVTLYASLYTKWQKVAGEKTNKCLMSLTHYDPVMPYIAHHWLRWWFDACQQKLSITYMPFFVPPSVYLCVHYFICHNNFMLSAHPYICPSIHLTDQLTNPQTTITQKTDWLCIHQTHLHCKHTNHKIALMSVQLLLLVWVKHILK